MKKNRLALIKKSTITLIVSSISLQCSPNNAADSKVKITSKKHVLLTSPDPIIANKIKKLSRKKTHKNNSHKNSSSSNTKISEERQEFISNSIPKKTEPITNNFPHHNPDPKITEPIKRQTNEKNSLSTEIDPTIDIPIKEPPYREVIYLLNLNNEKEKKTVIMLKDKKNDLLLNINDLKKWNLQIPDKLPLTWNDAQYYKLSNWQGLRSFIDDKKMYAELFFPAKSFKSSKFDLSTSKKIKFKPPKLGGYLNYTLADTHNDGTDSLRGFFSFNMFSKYGYGSSQYTVSNVANKKIIRQRTTWQYDQPDKMTTWGFGDLIAHGVSWSGGVNFAGIQYTSNFSTQPKYITFPLPGYRGTAIVPTALDLYINSAKRNKLQIDPSNFELTSIPIVSGSGDIRIVTTDILGRQQTISTNYFLDTRILKPGLNSFSYEAGVIRQNLGLNNFDYDDFVIAGTNTFSPNGKTSVEVHAEALTYEQAAGIGITRIFPKSSTAINTTIGISNNSLLGSKRGGQVSFNFNGTKKTFNYGVAMQLTSHYFTSMGIAPGRLAPRLTQQYFGGIQLGKSSLGFNYSKIFKRESDDTELFSLTFSKNIFFKIGLNLTVQDVLRGSSKGRTVLLNLTKRLGGGKNATYSGSWKPKTSYQSAWQIRHSLPSGKGIGYSFAERRSDIKTKNVLLEYQNNYGSYSGQYTSNKTQTVYNFNMSGSIIVFDGVGLMSRRINNGFGLVRVDGFKNVNVFSNNQLVGTTDATGRAIIPNLPPYTETKINIDPNSMSMSTVIKKTQAVISTWQNSGALATFKAKTVRSAILNVKQQNGKPVPEGADAKLEGVEEQSIVGMDGDLYLTEVSKENTLHLIWPKHDCVVTFIAPPIESENPIPDLGEFVCTETKGKQNDEQ